MDRAFKSGASATPPTAPAAPSIGYPSPGDAGAGVPPTKPGAWWYHMVTEELRNIVTAGGLTPAQGNVNQVVAALQAMFVGVSSFTGANQSLAASGFQRLPGGFILQWGYYFLNDIGGSADGSVFFPLSFPAACYVVLLSPTTLGGQGRANFATSTVNAPTQGGFAWAAREFNNDVTNGVGFYWFAIGR